MAHLSPLGARRKTLCLVHAPLCTFFRPRGWTGASLLLLVPHCSSGPIPTCWPDVRALAAIPCRYLPRQGKVQRVARLGRDKRNFENSYELHRSRQCAARSMAIRFMALSGLEILLPQRHAFSPCKQTCIYKHSCTLSACTLFSLHLYATS